MNKCYRPSKKTIELINEEFNKCIGCKKCMKKCPMLSTHCDNPKDLLRYLKDLGEVNDLNTLQIPFTCTLCSYCDQVCPQNVNLSQVFYTLKTDIVSHIGYPKSFGKRVIDTHQRLSFSGAFTTNMKACMSSLDCENDSGINKAENKNENKGESTYTLGDDKKERMIFYPGCSPSASNPKAIDSVFNYMSQYVETILYTKCCGNPTLSLGRIEQFNTFTKPLISEVEAIGPDAVVVLCMNCYNTLKKLFPSIRVITLWEFMVEHGIPSLPHTLENTSGHNSPVFSLHDPCPTREHSNIHEAVRQVLIGSNIKFEEFDHNKDQTVCCGSGAMLSLIHPTMAQAHKVKRASEAKTDHILTYCQECTESLKQEGKKTLHILDLFFNMDIYKTYDQKTRPTFHKWVNRLKVKRSSDIKIKQTYKK